MLDHPELYGACLTGLHDNIRRYSSAVCFIGRRDAAVSTVEGDGVFVQLEPGLQGFVPTAELDITHYPDLHTFRPGDLITVKAVKVRYTQNVHVPTER